MKPIRAATLTGYVLPEPEATAKAVRMLAALKEQGYKVLHGWDRKAPEVFIEKLGGTSYTIRYHSLLDHLYRLKHKGGQMVYVSEPYGICHGWDVLAELDAAGWDIQVDAYWALHYPGSTTMISFCRRQR